MPRQQIYAILILLSAGLILGRIFAVDRVDSRQLQSLKIRAIVPAMEAKEKRLRQQAAEFGVEIDEERLKTEMDKTYWDLLRDAMYEGPGLSGNDRSRLCTIRALVEPDLRVVRRVIQPDGTAKGEYVWYAINKVQDIKGWGTIDMVKHGLPDEPPLSEDDAKHGYLYSSKPPLLPTLMAVPYAAIYWGSGRRITMENDPFSVVRTLLILSNLIPLVLSWFLLARLVERFGKTDWGRIFSVAFICFGTFLSTFAVTINNHIPAVFSVTVALYCAVRIVFDDERRFRYYLGAGFFAAFAVTCELPALSFCVLLGLLLFCRELCRKQLAKGSDFPGLVRTLLTDWKSKSLPMRTLFGFIPAALIVAGAFFATNYAAHKTVFPAYGHRSWYLFTYEQGGKVRESYWKNPQGPDRGEDSRLAYIFHSSLGHHGVFLLTPVWLLSFAGLAFWLGRNSDPRLRTAALAILVMSVVVFSFYMSMAKPNRNYGGMTCALRWMFWFAPMWSVPLVTAADRLAASRNLRILGLILLMISALSAAYPTWNPWSLPWPLQFMYHMGWTV